jgi:hypothetical protein
MPAALALLAPILDEAMLADRVSAALRAPDLAAVVVAEDLPVSVPPHCTAALGVAAAAAIAIAAAAGTSASAAPAAGAATEMPRQTVDQILLLPPGLRQLKSGAQLLQLGNGLRARGQRNQT